MLIHNDHLVLGEDELVTPVAVHHLRDFRRNILQLNLVRDSRSDHEFKAGLCYPWRRFPAQDILDLLALPLVELQRTRGLLEGAGSSAGGVLLACRIILPSRTLGCLLSRRAPAYGGFRVIGRVGAAWGSTNLVLRHQRPRYERDKEDRRANNASQHDTSCSASKTRFISCHATSPT